MVKLWKSLYSNSLTKTFINSFISRDLNTNYAHYEKMLQEIFDFIGWPGVVLESSM